MFSMSMLKQYLNERPRETVQQSEVVAITKIHFITNNTPLFF